MTRIMLIILRVFQWNMANWSDDFLHASSDRFHLTLVRLRLYFVVIYLARTAGIRIIAYYWPFIDQYTMAIHSLCCLVL